MLKIDCKTRRMATMVCGQLQCLIHQTCSAHIAKPRCTESAQAIGVSTQAPYWCCVCSGRGGNHTHTFG